MEEGVEVHVTEYRPTSYQDWSWPDHDADVTDAEARMRMPRSLRENTPDHVAMDDVELARAYGRLLAAGKARVQLHTTGATTSRADSTETFCPSSSRWPSS